mgnify:CR=1 FL=1|jgi:hypothetical protein
MALVVEDGTLVSGADSYVTLAEFKAWADKRGVTYGTDSAVTQQIYRAMDYIESLNFIGEKSDENQALQWPRDQVVIDGYYIDSDEMPNELKVAVYESIKAEIDGDSRMTASDRRTISEKVGDLQVTYANNADVKRSIPAVTRALRKLIRPMAMVSRA